MARRTKRNNRRGGGNGAPRVELTEVLPFQGQVETALPDGLFRVIADNGMAVVATVCGHMKRYRIQVLPGDRVGLEVSAYDPTRGRIVYRHRPQAA